jgi:hypothetical protein
LHHSCERAGEDLVTNRVYKQDHASYPRYRDELHVQIKFCHHTVCNNGDLVTPRPLSIDNDYYPRSFAPATYRRRDALRLLTHSVSSFHQNTRVTCAHPRAIAMTNQSAASALAISERSDIPGT